MSENVPDATGESLSIILDIISDGIWDWNANTGYVYRNPAWYLMLGYDPHSLDNSVLTWENVIHEDDYAHVMRHFELYIHGESESYQVEYRCRTSSGDYIWIEDRGRIVERNEDGTVARMIGAHRNINDKKLLLERLASQNKSLESLVEERTNELIKVNAELEQQLIENKRLAETDTLTNVANRYRLEKVLQHEVARAQRFNETLSLIALDVDDFKYINDQFGHATGDLVLVHLTKLIKAHIREIDLLARWGGDEYMIVLPNSSLMAAVSTAEKILSLIQTSPPQDGISLTCSFGIAELQKGETSTSLTMRADNALYESKGAGKNHISI